MLPRRPLLVLLWALCSALAARAAHLDLTTATIADLQDAMNKGALTSEKLTELYLARIAAYNQQGPKINAFLFLNPDALAQARALDAERQAKGSRGPLHGIPIVLKDVFDTYDLPTTGGYLPLKGVKPTKDSFIAKQLRAAGVVIIGKTNQSDWYASPPLIASSTIAGNTLNPYDLKRTPGWSSTGTAASMAAVFGAAGLGSETGFSIRTPTNDANLYGLASTSGLISRDGQMWSYITGERGGPICRSMYDLCTILDTIAGFDTFDLWTAQSLGHMPDKPYVSFLSKTGLRGARVGVLKEGWNFTPIEPEMDALVTGALAVFEKNGAKLVNPVSLGIDLKQYLAANTSPSRFERVAAVDHYLARQGPNYPFHNAKELLLDHPEVPGRPANRAAIEHPIDLNHDPEYRASLAGKAALRQAVIDLMDKYQLDALIYPHRLRKAELIGTPRPSETIYNHTIQLSPITGLPALIVPMGFTPEGEPSGLEILGRPWSEPTLIKIGSGYEATAGAVRQLPRSTPILAGEGIDY